MSVGCVLVANAGLHRASWAHADSYLARGEGLSGGDYWPCDYGLALSRPFSALRVWATFKAYGSEGLRRVVEGLLHHAELFQSLLLDSERFDVLHRDSFVVVFRNRDSAVEPAAFARMLQLSGRAVLSTVEMNSAVYLRACFMNHRTEERHVRDLARMIIEEYT